MEVFYFKINRPTFTTCRYLAHWIETIKHIPDARAYVICDKPELTQLVQRTINFGEIYHEFMTSRRDSKEIQHIVQNAIVDHWKPAGYAHVTPILHAREMGYENFWNIDGDDLGLYAEPDKIAELLLAVKNYAEEHEIDAFSLDIWRTLTYGRHWSLGVVYMCNSANWLEIMQAHCKDLLLNQLYGLVSSGINADWFITYLNEIHAARAETFYVENLRIIHHSDDVYANPWGGIRYCENGRLYFNVLVHDFGMGEDGSIQIASDSIKFDTGITAAESMVYLKKFFSYYNRDPKKFELENHPEKIPVAIILPVAGKLNTPPHVIHKSLLTSTLWEFRLLVVDGGMNDVERAKFIRQDSMDVRFKILKCEPGASIVELMNAGLREAQSKYVMFLDATDIFIPETLAFLYNIAEQTQADVVHISAHFVAQDSPDLSEQSNPPLSVQIVTEEPDMSIGEYKIFSDKDLPVLLEKWLKNPSPPKIYNQLIRRDFLMQNKITFSPEADRPELNFGLQCIFHAEKYVKLAQPLYVHLPI